MSAMRRFRSIDELRGVVGTELGTSDWITVTQAMIDRFAEATGDFQWIHVDRERATNSPYGRTIAHGFLTLSLMPRLRDQIFDVDGMAARINYGCDRLRFIAPVPSESRIRLRLLLKAVADTPRGARVDLAATIELEEGGRPACVFDQIVLYVPA